MPIPLHDDDPQEAGMDFESFQLVWNLIEEAQSKAKSEELQKMQSEEPIENESLPLPVPSKQRRRSGKK